MKITIKLKLCWLWWLLPLTILWSGWWLMSLIPMEQPGGKSLYWWTIPVIVSWLVPQIWSIGLAAEKSN